MSCPLDQRPFRQTVERDRSREASGYIVRRHNVAAGHGLPSRKAIWVSSGPPGLPSGHQTACSGSVRCEPRYGLRLHRDSGLSAASDALTTMFVLEIGG